MHQFLEFRKISEIDFPNVNSEIWMLLSQFITQLSQSFLTTRHQNHRARAIRELPRKFAPDPSGGARDERATAVEVHFSLYVIPSEVEESPSIGLVATSPAHALSAPANVRVANHQAADDRFEREPDV